MTGEKGSVMIREGGRCRYFWREGMAEKVDTTGTMPYDAERDDGDGMDAMPGDIAAEGDGTPVEQWRGVQLVG